MVKPDARKNFAKLTIKVNVIRETFPGYERYLTNPIIVTGRSNLLWRTRNRVVSNTNQSTRTIKVDPGTTYSGTSRRYNTTNGIKHIMATIINLKSDAGTNSAKFTTIVNIIRETLPYYKHYLTNSIIDTGRSNLH